MTVSTPAPKAETMSLQDRMANSPAVRGNREEHKNRNRHSVKFPDDLEEDFQAWRQWHGLNDNAALRKLVRTHPDLKRKPEQ